ncbi:homocysteine S-methyltransferase [Desulfopila aestuarii]|uniref:S-methylmethionine:homocysteine methyltransferase n=1 Tax=Desulfopila aestuarii DSM 18488 TaxID=1121416 RepID=A0A1M7YBB7_9BACT|nr:homocysteine S-methyltransferase [Desulfopila aestuarii]SHO49913.1 homocysteine S-methyltransferase [Desulfopila aestuarii DSM 18488]
MNPIQNILTQYPLIILDGAFATELERRGCDLNDALWSAKVLIENPELISAVHTDYLEAGADCIITASYQATYEGFMHRGLSRNQARDLMAASVGLAVKARENFWADPLHRKGRPKPLVAASVGPYGAYLADGSEYRGDYTPNELELANFHRQRLETLIAAGPDILACETIPCLKEAKALVRLVQEHPGSYCWVTFSAKDGLHISNGECIRDCASWLDSHEQVAAVGVNCTAPGYVASLIDEIRLGTDKPIVVYPNSGEQYDGLSKVWSGGDLPCGSYGELARSWFVQGARLIGGCCRTTPADIRAISSWARDFQSTL